MKQIFQSLKNGTTSLLDCPIPRLQSGNVIIESIVSLVSLGTEKMLVEFGSASLISKAKQQPEKVKQVLDKIKSDGLLPTMEIIFNKLEEDIPLGYCNVGRIVEIGSEVTEFALGDIVVSNGSHAEYVSVPKNLVSKVPKNVPYKDASFTILGSIGLQGVRLIKPQLGETIVVFGLGLVGLLTCQILKANGCKVIGVDLNDKKCELATKYGALTFNPNKDNVVKSVLNITDGIGADGVIICASNSLNNIISDSAQMSRKKGRIVLVGVVGLNIKRSDFYEKELSFQVSCSYGPGRYDPIYEEHGIDYPLPYVRWTEKRNFETILHLLDNKNLIVKDLITNVSLLDNYKDIYDNLNAKNNIASIIEYPIKREGYAKKKKSISFKTYKTGSRKVVVGVIGAGSFVKSTILPFLKKNNLNPKSIASLSGFKATQIAKKYSIFNNTTNFRNIFNDKDINTVIIATRHDSHAELVVESLNAGKHTFVEKPLALTSEELKNVGIALKNNPSSLLQVGYNRRFSPHAQAVKKTLGNNHGPLNIVMTMNAGFIPSDHWVHDLKVGGGRIIGEACHLIDLCVFLSGSLVQSVCCNYFGNNINLGTDNVSIILKHFDGTNSTIHYFSNGSKKYSKERVEVYNQGRTWVIDNYRLSSGYDVKNFNRLKTKIDKGHNNQFIDFFKLIKQGGLPLIPLKEIYNVSKTSFSIIKSMKDKDWKLV